MHRTCLKRPSFDRQLPHLFYTNEMTSKHNLKAFDIILDEVLLTKL